MVILGKLKLLKKKLKNQIIAGVVTILVTAAVTLIHYWGNKPKNNSPQTMRRTSDSTITNTFNSFDSSQQINHTGAGEQTINNNQK